MSEWFKPRGYKHFDAPVGAGFANRVSEPTFVAQHSWLPLIHYTKRTKRYKAIEGRTVYKDRPIMYASHRDACILSRYAWELTEHLDNHYEKKGLSDHVTAYRKLGKANYDFSADAYHFAMANAPCVVLCFDITGFFDHLNHRVLKYRLKRILDVPELSEDWFKVFRHVTRFSRVDRVDLAANPAIAHKLKLKTREPIATIREIKGAGIKIHRNPNAFGIPQGTPISSALSNLYMIDVDRVMVDVCRKGSALYQRYSDDILIICSIGDEIAVTAALHSAVNEHMLEIRADKTERVRFEAGSSKAFQYLGFNISPDGASIRPSSLAKQWRKAKRSIARTEKIGAAAVAEGRATKGAVRLKRTGIQ